MKQIFIMRAMPTILHFLVNQQLTDLYSFASYHVKAGTPASASPGVSLEIQNLPDFLNQNLHLIKIPA